MNVPDVNSILLNQRAHSVQLQWLSIETEIWSTKNEI